MGRLTRTLFLVLVLLLGATVVSKWELTSPTGRAQAYSSVRESGAQAYTAASKALTTSNSESVAAQLAAKDEAIASAWKAVSGSDEKIRQANSELEDLRKQLADANAAVAAAQAQAKKAKAAAAAADATKGKQDSDTAARPRALHKAQAGSHDVDQVTAALKYYDADEAWLHLHPVPFDKYLTFETDCGGLNNIRMAFEYFVLAAWLTGRTLVLPPDSGWYLLDWGPMTRMKGEKQGSTSYGDLWDLQALAAGLPVITTQAFVKREAERLDIPKRFVDADDGNGNGNGKGAKWDNAKAKDWHNWLYGLGPNMSSEGDLKWNPLQGVIAWPDKQAVKDSLPDSSIKSVSGGRGQQEFTRALKDELLLNYPSCRDKFRVRFLGQIWGSVMFADRALERSAKRLLRDHVHWVPQAFELAGKAVAKLGLFDYASFHIRRNDLQYKESFVAAEQTMKHTQALLRPNETLYIATDETDEAFFSSIESTYHVVRWDDLFRPPLSVFEDGEVPRKLEGVVEQLICAGGRRFFGTGSSTFTAWIVRARGYIGAPDTKTYYHNRQYTGDAAKDAKQVPGPRPTDLYVEDPAMWTDLDIDNVNEEPKKV